MASCFVSELNSWLASGLVGWLVPCYRAGWSVSRVRGWLVEWEVAWLVGCRVGLQLSWSRLM